MKELIFQQNIAHLGADLADESNPAKRQLISCRIMEEIDKLSVAEGDPITPLEAYGTNYWRSRAEKARRRAKCYDNHVIRNHFMRIAFGYDKLAERAFEVQKEAEKSSRQDLNQAQDERFCRIKFATRHHHSRFAR